MLFTFIYFLICISVCACVFACVPVCVCVCAGLAHGGERTTSRSFFSPSFPSVGAETELKSSVLAARMFIHGTILLKYDFLGGGARMICITIKVRQTYGRCGCAL